MAIDELYSDLIGTGTNAQALRDALYANGADEAFNVQTHIINGQTIVARVRSDWENTIEIQSVDGDPYNPATHDSFFAAPNANASDGNPITRAFVDRPTPTPEQTVAVNAPATSADISNGSEAERYLQGMLEFLGEELGAIDNDRGPRTNAALAKALGVSVDVAKGLDTKAAIVRVEALVKAMPKADVQSRLDAVRGNGFAFQAGLIGRGISDLNGNGPGQGFDGVVGTGTSAAAMSGGFTVAAPAASTPAPVVGSGGAPPPETPESEEPEAETEEPEAETPAAPVYVLKTEVDRAVINIRADDDSETAVKDITFDDLKDLLIDGAPERVKDFLRLMVKDGEIDTGLKEQISDVLVAAGLDSEQIQAIRDSLTTDYDAQTDAAIDAELSEVDALIAGRASRPGQDLYEALIDEMRTSNDAAPLLSIIEGATIDVGPEAGKLTGIDAVYLMLENRTAEEVKALFRPQGDEVSNDDLSRAMVTSVLKDGTAPDSYLKLHQALDIAYTNVGFNSGISETWMLTQFLSTISDAAEIPNVIKGMQAVHDDAGLDFNAALEGLSALPYFGMSQLYSTNPKFLAELMDQVNYNDPGKVKELFQVLGVNSLEEYDAFLLILETDPVKAAVQGLRDDFAKSNEAIFPNAPIISGDFNTAVINNANNGDQKFQFSIFKQNSDGKLSLSITYNHDDNGKWSRDPDNHKLSTDIADDPETAGEIQAALKGAVYKYLGIKDGEPGTYNAQRMAALKELAVDHTTFNYDDTAEGMLHEILEDIEDNASYKADVAAVEPDAVPRRGAQLGRGNPGG